MKLLALAGYTTSVQARRSIQGGERRYLRVGKIRVGLGWLRTLLEKGGKTTLQFSVNEKSMLA